MRRCGEEEGEPCRFDEDFKKLKNLERSVVFKRDGGKKERRNCGLWRVYQSRRIRRGRKFKI